MVLCSMPMPLVCEGSYSPCLKGLLGLMDEMELELELAFEHAYSVVLSNPGGFSVFFALVL